VKAAEGSRTPRPCGFSRIPVPREASWSAAALCRFFISQFAWYQYQDAPDFVAWGHAACYGRGERGRSNFELLDALTVVDAAAGIEDDLVARF